MCLLIERGQANQVAIDGRRVVFFQVPVLMHLLRLLRLWTLPPPLSSSPDVV